MRVDVLETPDQATHYGITNIATFKIHLLRHNNTTMCTSKLPLMYVRKEDAHDLPLCKRCPWQTP